MDLKSYQLLEFINNRLAHIEKNIARLEEKIDFSIGLQRNNLIQFKHGENIDDSCTLFGAPYNDLSPEKAFKIYQNNNLDFILLDVSHKNFPTTKRIKDSLVIPLEELPIRYLEIESRTTPILILDENGLRSITACEFLLKKGFFNLNNISGGHHFWPGHKKSKDLALSN